MMYETQQKEKKTKMQFESFSLFSIHFGCFIYVLSCSYFSLFLSKEWWRERRKGRISSKWIISCFAKKYQGQPANAFICSRNSQNIHLKYVPRPKHLKYFYEQIIISTFQFFLKFHVWGSVWLLYYTNCDNTLQAAFMHVVFTPYGNLTWNIISFSLFLWYL